MICDFLSDRSLKLHKEYLEKLKLQYSILEKSFPSIVGKSISDIQRMKLRDKDEIISLRCNVKCHELFFDSFGAGNQASKLVKDCFGSEAGFLYEIYAAAKNVDNGFAFITVRHGRPEVLFGTYTALMKLSRPLLVLDLCEHAYFLDYGFDKDEYTRRMLPYLNLNKLG